ATLRDRHERLRRARAVAFAAAPLAATSPRRPAAAAPLGLARGAARAGPSRGRLDARILRQAAGAPSRAAVVRRRVRVCGAASSPDGQNEAQFGALFTAFARAGLVASR